MPEARFKHAQKNSSMFSIAVNGQRPLYDTLRFFFPKATQNTSRIDYMFELGRQRQWVFSRNTSWLTAVQTLLF